MSLSASLHNRDKPAPPKETAAATLRYVTYARKSTEEDERQTQSIGSQASRNLELARRTERNIVTHFEESRSAKEPGRVEFNRMLTLIDAGEIDGIIAWHPDRLARNEIDAASLVYRLRKGVLKDLAFVEYHFHNSPEGIMMLQIALSQSQYQVSKLSLDVKRGIRDKLDAGWFPHRAPLGYVNNHLMNKGQKTISPDLERFPLIRKAWDMLLTGSCTVPQIRETANEVWGLRTAVTSSGRGGQPVALSTLYRLFSNPFYAGYFMHDGVLYPGKHQPMLSVEDFDNAQVILRRQLNPNTQAEELPPALRQITHSFTGLIRCGHCGAQITASVVRKHSGLTYTYYHCCQGKGDCRKKGVSSEAMRLLIDAKLKGLDVLPEFLEWAKRDVEQTAGKLKEAEETAQAQRERSLVELTKRLDSLLEMRLSNLLSDEEYRIKRNELTLQKEQLTQAMTNENADNERGVTACRNVLAYMENVQEWFQNGDANVRRIIARAFGSNYVLTDGNLLVEPHPLLQRVINVYPRLSVEYSRIKLGDFRSESTKKQALEALITEWSGIWEANRTLAGTEALFFPDVEAQIRCLEISAHS